jgi:broad-specificity NMP kinase
MFYTTDFPQGETIARGTLSTCEPSLTFVRRGYHEKKLEENLDAEIFGVLIEEAREAFDEEIVVELTSEQDSDVDSNCQRIAQWVESWKQTQAQNAD